MRIGDLVRHKEHHGYMGIVVELGFRDMLVAWHDGELSWTYKSQMEVINESG